MSNHPKLRSMLRWLPGVIISLVAIYFLLKFIDIEDLLQAVRSFTWVDIAVIILLDILSFTARSLGWKNLLDGVDFKQAFLVVNEGYLFNNLIPRSGEVVRTLLVSGFSNISAFQVASSVLIERALDIVIAAAMFLSTLPFAIEMDWIKPIALALLIGFVILIVALFILARKSESVKSWLSNFKTESTFLHEKVFPKIGYVLDGLGTLNNPAKFARSLFWILGSWVCWTALLYFGITRTSSSAPLWWAIFAQGVLALGIALPSAPAGLGVYEGSMVAALSVFGFEESASLSIALMLHFTQILVTAVIGIYGLMSQGQSISALINRIWNREPESSNNALEKNE